jgi:phage terminase small subunit
MNLYFKEHHQHFMNENVENKPLTPKEERFCYEYLANGFNATKACIKAGYAEKSAFVTGSRLLRKAKVHERIQAMKDNLAETAGISALMIANEHAKIAFSGVAHLHNSWIDRKELEDLTEDQKACIQEISTKIVKVNIGSKDNPIMADVEYVRIKTYDKQKSLDAISELLGFNAAKKTELTGKDGKELFSRLTDEELEEKIKSLEKKNRLIDGK